MNHTLRNRGHTTDWSQVPVIIDVPAVSILLGVHPQTVFKLLRSGELKGKKIGREWRVLKDDMLTYLGVSERSPS